MRTHDIILRQGEPLASSSDSFRIFKPLLNNPVIISARQCSDDAMLLRTMPGDQAIAYEVRIGTMPGIWRTAGVYKADPEIRVGGLSPGLEYWIAARAVGTDGVSAWSDQAVCKSICMPNSLRLQGGCLETVPFILG